MSETSLELMDSSVCGRQIFDISWLVSWLVVHGAKRVARRQIDRYLNVFFFPFIKFVQEGEV